MSPRPESRARPVVNAVRNAAVAAVIVVDGRRRTLYRLSSATGGKLVCTGGCLRVWQPLTVRSTHAHVIAGAGVRGRLTIVRRPNGLLQIALRGMLLYRFSGDLAPGEAFGRSRRTGPGHWQVIPANGSLPRAAGGAKLPPKPPPI
jgi:predicted lipoprotein with Yx(FWY)xxD motif